MDKQKRKDRAKSNEYGRQERQESCCQVMDSLRPHPYFIYATDDPTFRKSGDSFVGSILPQVLET